MTSHLSLLLNQNARNGFIDALGGRRFVVLILRVTEAQDMLLLLPQLLALAFLLLRSVDFDIVAGVLNVGYLPLIDLVRPLRAPLNLHVLGGRDKLVDD